MKKMSNAELGDLFLQAGMMSRAGLDLGQAFQVLSEGSKDGSRKSAFAAVAENIRGGMYPDEAMQDSGLFPRQCCGLVAAGSESGKLDEALSSLQTYYTRMGRLEAQMKTALAQPLAMLGMSMAVFLLVILEVLPVFDDVYRSMGGSLDGMAGLLLDAGTWLRRAAPWIAIAVAALFAAILSVKLSHRVRSCLTAALMARFGDKGIFRALNDARYAQALSMGLDAGMTPEEASRMAASLFDDGTAAKDRYAGCAEGLSSGGRLYEILGRSGILDTAGAMLLETGLKAGCEPEAMRNAAASMLDAAERRIEKMSALVEPAVTAFGSGLTGIVVLVAMLPLLGVMSAIG